MVRLLILPSHQTQTLQFLWQDEQRTFHEILRDTPDSIKPQRPTEPELDSITLVDWPNTESIQMTLLRIACRESGFDGPRPSRDGKTRLHGHHGSRLPESRERRD